MLMGFITVYKPTYHWGGTILYDVNDNPPFNIVIVHHPVLTYDDE